MTDLMLRTSDQAALRSLLTAEPVPGSLLPSPDILELVSRLIQCDQISVGMADRTGCILEEVSLPRDVIGSADPQVCDGPLYLGIVRFSRIPDEATSLARFGIIDSVGIGFRSGPDHVVQLCLDRTTRPFSDRDMSMLALLAPPLERLMRQSRTPRLPESLTVQERRVLVWVAAGLSNAQIAQRLYVAPSTVRKHLEHAYRKLGVRSRMAAVAALQGADPAEAGLLERVERFA